MTRGPKTFIIVAVTGGIAYYLYHRHEAAASAQLTQAVANGSATPVDTAAPLSETGGNTGAMAEDPYALPNAGTPTYGTGAVGNGTPTAPSTQKPLGTPTPLPASTPQPIRKGPILIPGQTPPIIAPGRVPISPTKTVVVHNPETPPIVALPPNTRTPIEIPTTGTHMEKMPVSTPGATPPIVAIPNTSKVTTYMKG